MRPVTLLAAAFAVGGLIQTARGQTAYLLVRSDLECRLTVDGTPGGVLKAGNEIRVAVTPGEHRVEAVPLGGGARWETALTVKAADEAVLAIPLRAAVERAAVKEERGSWVDRSTQLMWAAADNGRGVSQSQAAYFCRTSAAGGFSDWALPAIDDLQRLFGGPPNESGHHVAGPIKLTGWEWSSSPGQEPGQYWALDFGDGARASVVAGDSGLNRALCVRRAGK
jgi:hypothetical protein